MPKFGPTTIHSRLGKFLDRVDVLLALIGTVLGAFASIISKSLLSRVSSLVFPFALTIGVTILTLLVSFSSIIPVAFGVFKSRAIQREIKLKKLLQKEKVFFVRVDDDISILLGKGGKQYAE